MLDANGRRVEVGDWVATPNLHISNGIPEEGAILGRVISVVECDNPHSVVPVDPDNVPMVHIGDGITYEGHEVVTLGGYTWYICLECNTPSPMDMRGGELVCPFCKSKRMEEDASVSYYTAAELSL